MVNPLLEFKSLAAQTLTSAGTAQSISVSEINVEAALIYADSANVGTIFIGGSTVDSTNGIPLAAGHALPVGSDRSHGATSDIDLKSIFFDGTNTSDKVRVMYMQRTPG